MSEFTPTPNHLKKFFAQMHKATLALGLNQRSEQDEYYSKVLSELAKVTSVKDIRSKEAFDSCLLRFAQDAGDFASALDYEIDKSKRYAYVIKVTVLQIMQLQRLDPSAARSYFDKVVFQSRRGSLIYSNGDTWHLDIPQRELLLFVKILDSHLRRLKKRYFPLRPIAFNDRLRYYWSGSHIMVEAVDKFFYANQPFKVASA